MGTPALHRPASPPRGDARLRPASRPASRHAWVLVAALLATACASEVQAAGQREPPAPASPAAAPAASAARGPASLSRRLAGCRTRRLTPHDAERDALAARHDDPPRPPHARRLR